MDNVTLGDGSVQTQNVGTVWAHGLEGEVQKTFDDGANLRAYLTFVRREAGITDVKRIRWRGLPGRRFRCRNGKVNLNTFCRSSRRLWGQ